MYTLIKKDLRINRLPIVVAFALFGAPYVVTFAMLYQVYAPDVPSLATIADYLASAAVFGLLFSVAIGGMVAGNCFACERADDSSVFLACQPVSRLQILSSKAALVSLILGTTWLIHCTLLLVVAPILDENARPFVSMENPIVFSASALVVATGVGWMASILGRSPSMAICAGLGAAFFVPWFVYMGSHWISISHDGLLMLMKTVQWMVGVATALVGSAIYLKRVEP